MPDKPLWLAQLAFAERVIRDYPGDLISREVLEQVLGLKRRQAIRLLHQLGATSLTENPRSPLVASKGQVLAAFRRWQADPRTVTETQRRTSLAHLLTQARHELPVRLATVAPSPTAVTLAGLDPRIRLAPGELRITFEGAEDLAQRLMELVMAITRDYEGFADQVGGHSPLNSPSKLNI